jgi:DNA-binding winged helix-turn-helix (wHTH) protein/TolB-like protein
MAESRRVRFGIFDFDLSTRELWRDGVAVRLQAQPSQALALLIAHAGEVVTRDQLRQALWGEETFVDFDRSLNFCIGQIRTALGDSAESPRFVRTLPKRGYQFIAPVTVAPVSVAAVATAPPAVASSFARRFLPITALVGTALVVGLVWSQLRTKPVEPAMTVAVLRFDNETGDAAFLRLADALTDSVVGEMTVAGAERYAVIGNASVLRGPREGRDLLAIGSSLKAGYVVMGQVQRDAAGLRILAHLIRLPDQKHVWVVRQESTSEQAESGQSVLARRIAAEFSQRLNTERARQTASLPAVNR